MSKIEEKKKRGRKPKKKTEDIILHKIPKKRGRKPKHQDTQSQSSTDKNNNVYQIENYNDSKDNSVKNENIILHLNVHSQEAHDPPQSIDNFPDNSIVDNNYSVYPFNCSSNNLGVSNIQSNELETKEKTTTVDWVSDLNFKVNHINHWNGQHIPKSEYNHHIFNTEESTKYKEYDKKVDSVVKQFQDCNKRNIWPSHTPIYCFWCSHPFNHRPCAIPITLDKDTFKVYGNFCSPECAASYNFSENIDTDNKWERYSLLNQLYRKILNNKDLKIKLAPPRNSLNIFGGPLSINEFRKVNSNYEKNYIINLPPLVSIIPQIEEVVFDNEKVINKDTDIFIPLDEERLENAANESLKLKRNKPLSESRNTLESCMNLQFK